MKKITLIGLIVGVTFANAQSIDTNKTNIAKATLSKIQKANKEIQKAQNCLEQNKNKSEAELIKCKGMLTNAIENILIGNK